jgi:hypothetical protein
MPNTNTYVDFFTAANFLAYGNALYTVRVINEAGVASSDVNRARNATTNSGNTTNTIIKNEDDYNNNYVNGITGVGNWVAKYPGRYGSSLRITVCPSANAYESIITATGITATNNSTTLTISVTGSARTGRRVANSTVSNTVASAAATSIASANAVLNGGSNTSSTRSKNLLTVGDILILGPDKIPLKVGSVGSVSTTTATSVSQAPNSGTGQAAIISAVDTSTFNVTLQTKYVGNTSTSTSVTRRWEYFDYAPSAPATSIEVARSGSTNDEMHVAIIDEDGLFTGYSNTILEIYPNLSKAVGAKNETGTDIYYKN